MVQINGKQLCENCFAEQTGRFCTQCGYTTGAVTGDPTMLKPGSVLLGKYIVGKVMGKGGFGVTYLAFDITAGRKVAIKEFFPYGVALRAAGTTTVSVSSVDNADAFKLGAEKFYNEAKLVSKFNGNPNIVGVYEFFYENDTVYFAMEYLKGHTLKEHIEEHGVLTPPQALFIMQNVANALMAAHSSSVLHRDISPDNIILCDNGDVKLIDFGAARQVVAEHSQSLSVILKPGFAPLEQYQKKGNQGPWTDIYSLGATIYYSLTEDIPEDPMSRLDDDEAYSSNQYNIDPELWSVISKATQLKIDDRYDDIFMLKNDLSKISFAAEPVVTAKAEADKMPEFRTAVPYGMAQNAAPAAPQPAPQQPVGVGAPYGTPAPVPQAPPAPYNASMQPAPYGTPAPAPAKRPRGKFIAICAGVACAIAAAIIIPISVNNSKNKIDTYPGYSASTPGKNTQTVTDKTYTDPYGNMITYTGDWSNNMPNGQGKGIFSNDTVYIGGWKDGKFSGQGNEYYINRTGLSWIEGGTYEGGNLKSGTYLDSDSNEYEFLYGGFDLNGMLSGTQCYRETLDSSGETRYYLGTFDSGKHISGEEMFINSKVTTIGTGDWDSSGKMTGYIVQFNSSGSVLGYYKYTNGKQTEQISAAQAANISELKKFDAQYISKVTSNHYGYKNAFNQLAADLATYGGPSIY